MKKNKNENFLKKKLKNFEKLAHITENFLEQNDVNELKLSKIEKFFAARQKIVDNIQQLEKNKPKRESPSNNGQTAQQISSIAKDLVDFDKRIFQILSEKKKKIVKDIKNIADIRNRRTRKRDSYSRKLVDIEG